MAFSGLAPHRVDLIGRPRRLRIEEKGEHRLALLHRFVEFELDERSLVIGIAEPDRRGPVTPADNDDIEVRGRDILLATVKRLTALRYILLHTDRVVTHPAKRPVDGNAMFNKIPLGRRNVNFH